MLCVWPYLLLLIPAIPLACEDFRTRQVAIVWLVVLGAETFAVAWSVFGFGTALFHTGVNTGLLSVLGALMVLYLFLRRRLLRRFFVLYFGAGDVVVMLAVTPLFDPIVFVRFLLAANLAALGWWVVRRPTTIPFAGFVALALVVYVVYRIVGLWS